MRNINDKNKYILKKAIKYNQPLDNFNTSRVTDMNGMFDSAKSFNQPLDNFNTSNVTNMLSMFQYATSFNQPLDNFDTSKVTKMGCIFCGAKSFNQPLDNFDLSNITEMESMFEGATSMFIGYIMRFTAKIIFIYNNYYALHFNYGLFSNSEKLDKYIIHLYDIENTNNNQTKIQSAIDGFIVD